MGKWSINIHIRVVSPHLLTSKFMKRLLFTALIHRDLENLERICTYMYSVYRTVCVWKFGVLYCVCVNTVTCEHLCPSSEWEWHESKGSTISLWSTHLLRSLATFIIYISLCPSLSLPHPVSLPFTSLLSRALFQPPCQGDQLLCRKGLALWWVH